jgi:hypothetical protein
VVKWPLVLSDPEALVQKPALEIPGLRIRFFEGTWSVGRMGRRLGGQPRWKGFSLPDTPKPCSNNDIFHDENLYIQ